MSRIAIAMLALCAALRAALWADACRAAPGAIPAIPVIPAIPATSASAGPEQAAARQVLVMLRLPPRHFRPDSAYGGGYAGGAGQANRRRLARALAAEHGLKLVNAWPMPAIGVDCFVMEEVRGAPVEQALAALARDRRILWAQPVSLFEGMGGVSDPLLPVQPAGRDWQLAAVHRASTGRGVTVAVIDSGIDAAHPDLLGQVAARENFVDASPDAPETHGTAVAGIIAARTGNGIGIAGIAPGARLMALRACWEETGAPVRCNSFTLGRALNHALMYDARVINLSLAGPPDRLMQALIDAALARGIAVVGAFDARRAKGGFPASHPGVIAVAPSGWVAGAAPGAMRAPGVDVPTCVPGARWGLVSGSSYAAAHVSGLLALMVELQGAATPAQLHSRLRAGASAGFAQDAAVAGGQADGIDACALLACAIGARP